MPEATDTWYDDDAGPVVRPYAMTRGRTRPVTGSFDLISLVVSTRDAAERVPAAIGAGTRGDSGGAVGLTPEQIEIVGRCRQPLSVAELAAGLDLPIGTVRVLLGDLLAAGLIEIHEPLDLAAIPGDDVLQAVLAGLRTL
jgi:DNA-binding transcriptional ArsR family regulator